MNAVHIEITVQSDGELHLTNLPCRRGDKIEAVIRIVQPTVPSGDAAEREAARAAALTQYLTIARSSAFRSAGLYPSRDDLHKRH